MELHFSIIIPIYNRPDELSELLLSIERQRFDENFEVVVVEDGSDKKSDKIVEKFYGSFPVKYFFKENSGPGQSRNYGMERADGNYFIILDSDVILPRDYLFKISEALKKNFTDAFGGPDAAHTSFTKVQKAVNYAMTSFLTTGGLRGSDSENEKFQLRSFNLGLSRKAFQITGGFARQNFGEDIDLTFRIWKNKLTTQYLPEAFVYHKRRTSWKQFFKQTFNFGAARPILNKMYPGTAKITYWFPSFFLLGFIFSLLNIAIGNNIFISLFGTYFLFLFLDATFKNRSLIVGIYSICATIIQFMGYGMGFLQSFFRLHILGKSPKDTFPEMFS